MKSYAAQDIRNICLVSHGGVGKTTLLEAMTYTTKGSNRIGRTDQGSSMFDTTDEEKQREMTIGLKTSFVEWEGKKINIIDTPGFIEFLAEAKGAIRAVESALILVDAVDGIQVGTEQVYGFVNEEKLPRLFYLNNMDRDNADYDKALQSLIETYGTSVAPIQIPIGQGQGFKGIINLLTMEAFEYQKGGNGIGRKGALPEDQKARAEELRGKLMESVAESDEELMNKFFDAGELTNEELTNGLLKGISSGLVFPVTCGAAVHNMGTDLLLNNILSLCPAADSVTEVMVKDGDGQKESPVGKSQPFLAQVYKTISDKDLGAITFMRIFSGSLKSGSEAFNLTTGKSERIGGFYAMRGKTRNELTEAEAGDLCATLKLKDTHTGDTLSVKGKKIELPPIQYPSPLVEKAIYPKSKGDEEKIGTGLTRLREEDPTFHYGFNRDIKQTIIAGMGDVHIGVIMSGLKKRFNVEAELRNPKIPYRETIKGAGGSKYRHKKQTGGAGQFAEVWMRIEPRARGEGVEFSNSLVGQNVDRVFVPSVEKGVNAACEEGVLAGYRIVDVKVDFYDGKQHPVDSKDIAFQIAGKAAFKESFMQAKPCLLEPIYEIEVNIPEEYTGDIMGDISSRRGKIGGMEMTGKYQAIKGKIPFSELSNYMQTLRSITQGRGYYTRQFSHYEEVPGDQAVKLLDQLQKQKEQEAAAKA